jgi:aspartate aminotransferase
MGVVLADRLATVQASATLKVAAEAERLRRAGFNVVDFSAGEPDFPTPQHVKDAGKAAIDANFTRYTPAPGIPELRQAVCDRYKAQYGVDITPAEVLMTVGGKQALFNTALALINPGDEVITHAPYWPTIPEQVKLVGGVPVIVASRPEDGFAVHAEKIIAAITPRTKAIFINSPANPTGALVDEATVSAIADAAAKQGIWIIVDLCYEQLIYEDVPHNLPKVLLTKHRDRTVLAGSASKAYAMTGWRCGWTIAPKELTAAFNIIRSFRRASSGG